MWRGLGVLIVGVACNHTPEELVRIPPDAPGSVTTSSVATASAVGKVPGVAPSRCIFPTPETAPPRALAAKTCPPDPLGKPPKADLVGIRFDAMPMMATLEAEVARSPAELERGLMFRTFMPPEHGMIFLMGEHDEHSFWMHNTCIPLDMLFVDDDGTIVGILENVPTLNDDTRSVGCKSNYVIETNAGWCRRHNVKAGQKITLPSL